jgi:hypothetical protein
MVVFDVFRNGQLQYSAGVGTEGALFATLAWARLPFVNSVVTHLYFFVTGQISNCRSVQWPRIDLSVGDEIRIRIVDADECDDPSQNSSVPSTELTPDGQHGKLIYRAAAQHRNQDGIEPHAGT